MKTQIDKDEDFKAHYLSNKETLFSIYKQILLSDMVSSEVVAIYEAIDTFNGTTKPTEKQSDSMIPIGIPIRSSYRWAGMDGLSRKSLFDKITTLLDRTKGLLEVVKQCSSVSDVDYRKLSTRIVSMALNDVIQIVNNSTSSRVSYDLELISTISDAYFAILKMDSFDMTSDFKKHFDEQKQIISQMEERSNPFMHSVDNKSSRTTQRSQTSTTRPYSSTSNSSRTFTNRQTTSTSRSSSSNSSDDTFLGGCFVHIVACIITFIIIFLISKCS